MFEKFRQRLKTNQKRPYQLFQVEPSMLCNLECVMCPWTEIHAQGGALSADTFARIAEYLPLASEVDFTGGGEPLKNPLLLEIVAAAKEAGCKVGFSTNGVLLTPQVSQALVSIRLDWISFSVDAATAETYERIRQGAQFETVVDNIAALRDAKASLNSQGRPKMMMVFVMMTGSHENYQQLPAYVDLAHSLGVEQIIAKNLDVILKDGDDARRIFSHDAPPMPGVTEVLEQARERADKLGVGLRLYALQPQEQTICEHDPIHNLYFNWQGYISPCITLSYAENRYFDGERVLVPCLRFGDINAETLEQIWEKPAYRAFRGIYEERLRLQRQALMDVVLGGSSEAVELPPAPEGCRTCYYLYGV